MTHRGSAASFHVGETVRCERDAPPAGTWSRYAGRVGTVVTINRADNEIGVTFERILDVLKDGGYRISWFRPSELVVVHDSPVKASRSAATPLPGINPPGAA